MRHTFVKLMGLMLALTLALTGCNLIGIDPMMQLDEDFAKLEKDYSVVVADYDGGQVTKADVLGTFSSMYNYYSQMYSMFGMSMNESIVNDVKQQSLEHVVEGIAMKKEMEKRGLSLTEEKLQEVQKAADEQYQQAYDSFFANAEGKDDVKARQTEYDMYQNGYSKDMIYNTELHEAEEALLQETVKAEISELTDEELKTAYDAKVTEDEEQYKDDASAFETAMSSEDDIVTWMPEGYRTVKHILVKPEDAVMTAVTDAHSALETAEEALKGFEDELAALNDAEAEKPAEDEAAEAAEATEEAEPVEAPRTAEEIQKDIDKAKADVETAQKDVETADQAALDAVKEKTDEIYKKIEAGDDFASLIAEYGEDPGMQNEPTATRGYYVAANSANWDKNFTAGAMALEKVGDVTMTPVVSTSGVHIIRYESDVTSGAVPLEDVHDALYKSTLETRQEDHYTEALENWTKAINPVYHLDAFTLG